ncbi:MAG: c-type cytochrome [Deltaproteobacteria bacterium]|nr:c-type cytochrome [Deltaproteobacteria bacterium]
MRLRPYFQSLLLLVAIGLAACSSKKESPAESSKAVAPSPSAKGGAQAEADEVFNMRCAPCHGSDGSGSGPAAAALQPKPRDFRDKAWQSTVTDEQVEKAIKEGGAAVGKSPAMPASPDLAAKPEVISALRDKVRGFAR